MGDISKFLPENTPTVAAIYKHYKEVGESEPQRGYLGASIIGHPCSRYLWYCFRNCCREEFSGRMYRLFQTGHLEEDRLANDLQEIGCTVHLGDPQTPLDDQFSVSALGGHFSGHLDGCALGIPEALKTWHVLEFKTHNAKSFAKLKKKGVKEAFPKHYAQMQIYMHLTGMKRALYLAKNKDTDELYSERIRYDKQEAEVLILRAKMIITSTSPPERLSESPDFYQCNWCSARKICFGTYPPEPVLPLPSISCRQCCHSTPKFDGDQRWVCEKYKRALSQGEQNRACDDHLVLPGLLLSFHPIDYGIDTLGNDYIHFDGEGGQFIHGTKGFSTKELIILPIDVLINKMIAKVKEVLGAEATGCTKDILDRYSDSDSETLWKGRASELVEAWKDQFNEHLPDLAILAKTILPDHVVCEYQGQRIAIGYPITKEAEIKMQIAF